MCGECSSVLIKVLLPLQIPFDFPDPALTLAVTPGSWGVRTPLAVLPHAPPAMTILL